ncbi:unnamed protein product [Effrenium voratum]|nr:unnamed protein product [Effrenium voratum]
MVLERLGSRLMRFAEQVARSCAEQVARQVASSATTRLEELKEELLREAELQAEGRASELEQRAAHEADAVRKAAEAMEAAAFSRCQRTGELLDQFRQEVSQEEQSARESVLELRKQAEEAGPRLAGLEARLREELQLAAGRADHFAEKSAEKAAEKLEELQRRLNAELRTVQDQAQEQRAAQEALEELQQETSECRLVYLRQPVWAFSPGAELRRSGAAHR